MRRPERRFYFQLARQLGMTVGQLLRNIGSRELSEWMALQKIEADERKRAELEAKARRNESMLRGKRGHR